MAFMENNIERTHKSNTLKAVNYPD